MVLLIAALHCSAFLGYNFYSGSIHRVMTLLGVHLRHIMSVCPESGLEERVSSIDNYRNSTLTLVRK